jgi:hypothetical protein
MTIRTSELSWWLFLLDDDARCLPLRLSEALRFSFYFIKTKNKKQKSDGALSFRGASGSRRFYNNGTGCNGSPFSSLIFLFSLTFPSLAPE